MQQPEHIDASSSFHIVVADVDVKVKIVSIGQAGEAVNIFCTQTGNKRAAWDAIVEAQAQNLLEQIRQSFPAHTYKAIPLMARNCAGLKVHRIQESAWRNQPFRANPSDDTMEIYQLICEILQGLSDNPKAINTEQHAKSRHSFHNSVAEQALRNEISRILAGSGQIESKVNSLMRLMDKNTH